MENKTAQRLKCFVSEYRDEYGQEPTQTQLADFSGVPLRTVQRYYKGILTFRTHMIKEEFKRRRAAASTRQINFN